MVTAVLSLALLVWAAVAAAVQRRQRSDAEIQLFPRNGGSGDPVRSPPPRSRSVVPLIAIGVAALWVVVGLPRSWLSGERIPSAGGLEGPSTQLTFQRGVEASPSFSPDGEWIAYRGETAGSGDILLRDIRGNRILNLTGHLNADESDPAFSPDGRQIAFRSSFRNGGLYLIDREGKDVRRLTSFGASPAWTPDGRAILFATRSSLDPRNWGGLSEGWTVDVTSGRVTRITRGDFRQPSVSPDGRYVAYWSAMPPSLDAARPRRFPRIRVASIDGRNPRQVGSGAWMDWSPAWSPDGDHLYFLSDRGGHTAIWRAPIDRRTGAAGDAVPVGANSETATHLTIAHDGRRLAWSTLESSPTMFRVAFEPDARSIRGDPAEVAAGPPSWRCAEPSPDGSMLAVAADDGQPDIYVVRIENGRRRAVTTDEALEGCPRWSPDGTRIIFHSDAGGLNRLWIAASDGTGLRIAASATGELTHPVWSPDGGAVVAWDSDLSTLRLIWLSGASSSGSEIWPAPLHAFTPIAWSPDGTSLIGTTEGNLWIFDRETAAYEPLMSGSAPTWLSTSRRIIFATEGRLAMLDLPSRYTRAIMAVPDVQLDAPLLSPDNRWLYFNRNAAEANLWMLTFN
ncbi:MAG TPA: hypothetical protein VFO14_08285 [Vicinamibacterales bacterium]|nr:hypothetical protein [Vicinamibacterales bacterium]